MKMLQFFFFVCVWSLVSTGIGYSEPIHENLGKLSVEEAVEKGKTFFNQEQFDKAEEYFTYSVEKKPDNPDYLCWLAQTKAFILKEKTIKGVSKLSLLGQGRKVKNLYEKAYEIDPRHERARIGYAIILRDIPGLFGGDLSRAEKMLKEVIEDNPESFIAYHHLGTLYIRKHEKLRHGIEYLKKAIEIAESKEDLTLEEKDRLANTYHALGKTFLEELEDSEQAIQDFEKSLKLDDNNVVTMIDLSRAYTLQDKQSNARKYLKNAAKIAAANEYEYFYDDIRSSAKELDMRDEIRF